MPSLTQRRLAAAAAILAAALAASGCAVRPDADFTSNNPRFDPNYSQSALRLGPDFGVAVRQDMAAQIADPDAQYAGVPAPASNGVRTASAQKRYETGRVIQPANAPTSSAGGAAPTAATGP